MISNLKSFVIAKGNEEKVELKVASELEGKELEDTDILAIDDLVEAITR